MDRSQPTSGSGFHFTITSPRDSELPDAGKFPSKPRKRGLDAATLAWARTALSMHPADFRFRFRASNPRVSCLTVLPSPRDPAARHHGALLDLILLVWISLKTALGPPAAPSHSPTASRTAVTQTPPSARLHVFPLLCFPQFLAQSQANMLKDTKKKKTFK